MGPALQPLGGLGGRQARSGAVSRAAATSAAGRAWGTSTVAARRGSGIGLGAPGCRGKTKGLCHTRQVRLLGRGLDGGQAKAIGQPRSAGNGRRAMAAVVMGVFARARKVGVAPVAGAGTRRRCDQHVVIKRSQTSCGSGLARDQALMATRRLIAGQPAPHTTDAVRAATEIKLDNQSKTIAGGARCKAFSV